MSMRQVLKYRPVLDKTSFYLIAISLLCGTLTGIAASYSQARREVTEQAMFITKEVLDRSELISEQIQHVFNRLENSGEQNPCGPTNQAIMRSGNLSSSYLQLVGYAAGSRLICSSYGDHAPAIELGPPTYTTPAGYDIRTKVSIPFDEGSSYVASTHQTTGFTAFLLPNLTLDVARYDKSLSLGLYGADSGITILSRGDSGSNWLNTKLSKGDELQLIMDDHVIAIKRSARFQYSAYSALPISRLHGLWLQHALVLVPMTLLLSALLCGALLVQRSIRTSLHHQLRMAIRSNDQLFMAYQPIVEISTSRWIGAESLVRWRQSSGQVVPPDVFVPMADHSGLTPALTEKIIDMVCGETASLLRENPDFHVNINFSALDLESTGSLEKLIGQLNAQNISRNCVTVEITEGALLKIEHAKKNTRLMHEYGLKIAIDDFGTGYCGLNYLHTLELDFLKIDKSFVDTIGTGAAARSVIPHIVQMAKSLGLEVVAEGVETAEQLEYLKSLGVRFAQGWFFSKAVTIAEIRRRVGQDRLNPELV